MKVPLTNFDTDNIKLYVERKINRPESQCTMVLIVVSMALLLDNMLYMVIVPIVPHYMDYMKNKGQSNNESMSMMHTEEGNTQMGLLFACKAIVQLLINPLSGTVIDRIGYDIPMMIGLIIIFVSTSAFAFGQTLEVMFLARGLQGVGSAFADTSGLAMIADRFTEESSRTTALGIALAFISFGSLVAPPFGAVLYQYCGKEFPFFCLAFIALLDGFLLMMIMKPVRLERREMKAEGNLPKGTPIQKLFMDPYIAICAGTLAIANVSLAFLEPTITSWMLSWRPVPSESAIGLIWLPAFFPHVAGVFVTVKLAAKYPQYQWLMAGIGLALEGISCIFIPFCSNFGYLMIPISLLCFGIALVDTAILPTLGYLVDTRHVSVYGSVYAIADISYSLAYAIGPIVAGSIVSTIGFTSLNIIVFVVSIAYCPVLYLMRNIYQFGITKLATDQDPEIIRPSRKKSYLMNGTSLEAKNLENIHYQNHIEPNSHDFPVEQASLIAKSHEQSYNSTATNSQIYSQNKSSSNFSSEEIRKNQYGY
uniref:Slc18a-6 n=1 Tax=Schmidtea mediterranea TaxID=79327 RepID=A0A0H3YJ31_SCHMD|nr:slc18a-6 [Schmidtea mediterranea]